MTRISEKDYRALTGEPPKKNKYNNRKPEYYDPDLSEVIKFDSVKEYQYYLILKDRFKRQEITFLQRQVNIEIQPAFTTPSGEKYKAITYKADFTYFDFKDQKTHYIDVKGFKTEIYKLKKKLLAYKGIYIEEV